MKRSVETAILAGFGLAVLILVVVGVLAYRATLNVEAAADDRAHLNQVRFTIQSVLSLLQDAETGQRGYLITGDQSYLEPYNRALAQVSAATASLRALTAGQPAQQQRLDALDPLVRAELAELQQTIDLRRLQGFNSAQAVVLSNRGKLAMDGIRGLLADMLAEEDQLYQARDAALTAELANVRWVAAGGGLLAVLAVAVALAVIRRELNRRQQAEAGLAAQAQQLASERDLLQALLDHSPDTIYFKDRASRFTRINRAQTLVLGVPEPSAAVGKTDFDFQPERVSQPSFEREQQIIASGQPLIEWVEFVPTPEGAPRWFSSTKIPLRDAAGQITGLVGISRDITEHQLAQANLERQVQQRTRLLRMLSECNQSLVRATDETELLDGICRSLVAHGGYALAWVGLAAGDGDAGAAAGPAVRVAAQAASGGAGPAAQELPPLSQLEGLMRDGQPVITHDLARDPAWADWQTLAARLGWAAAMAQPFGQPAQPSGVLIVCATAPEAFNDAEVELLRELAGDLNYGLAALRTRADLRLSAERSGALATLSKDLAEVSTDYQAALAAVTRLLAERVGDGCALYLVSADGRWLEAAAIDHRDPGAAEALQALKAVTPARADEGLSGRVLQTGQSLLVPVVDPAALRASLSPEYGAYLDRYAICSLLCVALRAEGQPLGTLVMSRSTPERPYTAADQGFLEEVAGRVSLVIANARLYARLEQRVRERTQALEAAVHELAAENAERQHAEAEIRALNQTLAQKLALLDAANNELEAFSYSVSHDLRAPLRALDGFSQILLEDYASRLDPQGQNYLQRVRAASQKMGELIDALLALARLTRAEMRHETVDLSALARAALADLQAADPQRQVQILLAEGLTAQGDPRLLRVVLDNLLGNAWKFTSKTPQARIELGRLPAAQTPAQSGEQTFFVRDNGAGFDMAHADRLFGAFQRLHQQTDFPGSGIGLATVQRVLHRHGGRAWAEGQLGQGATLYFSLPTS